MNLKLIIGFCVLLFATASCKREDVSPKGSSTHTVEHTESASFTLNGYTTTFESVDVQYTENIQYLTLSASKNNRSMQFECRPIPISGSYTSSQTMGLMINFDDIIWFCNSGCNIVVNEHNADLKWFDVSVSGNITNLFGTNSATLNSARIKAFY